MPSSSYSAVLPRLPRPLCLLCFVVVLAGMLVGASVSAAAPSVPAYGEVARFGGLDEGADYKTASTSNLQEAVGSPARFVDPLGMAVDTSDPNAPQNYALYVLDLVNPQALAVPGLHGSGADALALEYRIQKVGVEGNLLASTKFTLSSSASAPGLHASSLAVDPVTDSVYVLLADIPPTQGNSNTEASAAYSIESWSAGREAKEVALSARKVLIGPEGLQPGSNATPATLMGDVRGESIVVDDAGSPSIALAGEEYTKTEGWSPHPVLERIATSGAEAGKVEAAKWSDQAATEDPAAQYFPEQKSEVVNEASANPDGTINLSLGPRAAYPEDADEEPNMATISGDLAHTNAILPWASSAEEEPKQQNMDRAATIRFHQETEPVGGYYSAIQPSGASVDGGTLAPSVVQLAGEQNGFPSGVYAGVVAQIPNLDEQSGKPFSWIFGSNKESGPEREIVSLTQADLAIRLFDPQGESLGMIANTTAGGPCNLQGGPYRESEDYGSFVALAPGRDGVLFALVQSDLDENKQPLYINPSAPLSKTVSDPVEHVPGDQIVEFAPGAGSECPQPKGGFSIVEQTSKGSGTPRNGVVTVPAGTTLKFESEVNLQGGSPWAYEWESGDGHTVKNKWIAENRWLWPSPQAEFKYTTPGEYTAKLNLVNDFGVQRPTRTVDVVTPSPITETKIGVAGALTVGQPVSFTAAAKLPKFDSVEDYHWEFGDGTGADQAASNQEQHEYAAPGTYTVKLTITDGLGQKSEASETVTIAPAPIKIEQKAPASPPSIAPPTAIAPIIPPTIVSPPLAKKPLTRAQKLANALKACNKLPKKRRATCQKQAKKRYAPPKGKHKKARK